MSKQVIMAVIAASILGMSSVIMAQAAAAVATVVANNETTPTATSLAQ